MTTHLALQGGSNDNGFWIRRGAITTKTRTGDSTNQAQPQDTPSVLLGPVGDVLQTLNNHRFTDIFIRHPFTQEEARLFSDCSWTNIELEDFGIPEIVAFLRNPSTGYEALVFKNGNLAMAPRPGTEHDPLLGPRPKHSDLLAWHAGWFAALASSQITVERTDLEIGSDVTNIPPDEIAGAARVQDNSILTKKGIRYFPLALAAWAARASESTISKWVQKRTKFGGRSLQTYMSPITNALYLSEESVHRMAERFVNWPSNKPTGRVTLGETSDQSGYLAMAEAARLLSVSPRTMWLWASRGKAPRGTALDVIKCTTSEHFYIKEKDIYDLKHLVPRSGLQRGRRPSSLPPHP